MESGRDLWAGARQAWREAGPRPQAPDPLSVAAYLDGTLEPAARERVEAWMARDPDALELLVAARAAAAPAAAPQSLVQRARALVRDGRPARVGLGARLSGLLAVPPQAWRPLVWGGVAAAVLVVSASGFELGRQGTLQVVALEPTVDDDLGLGLSGAAEDLL